MGAFEDVKLVWREREYTIPARNMMRAIAIIEDHVTMPELQQFAVRKTAPLSRLSSAFAGVLTFAGCPKVSAEDVYAGMFDGGDQAQAVAEAVTTLMAMMLPKSARDKLTVTGEIGGDVAPGNASAAVTSEATDSSKKRSSSRSGQVGSRRRNSGNARRKKSIG